MFSGTLPHDAQDALAVLGKSGILGEAYLAGGTALALHLGHRISVDFDFFTAKKFDFEATRAKLEASGTYESEREEDNTMLGYFNQVRFSLFWYQYPLIERPEEWMGIKVASTADIAAMKLLAISTRATKKDYVDLYFLAKEAFGFEKMLEFYELKYSGKGNAPYYVIQALQYFEDVDKSEMPEMIKSVSWEEVKEFLSQETLRLAKTKFGLG